MKISLVFLTCGLCSGCVIIPVPSRSHIAPSISGRVIDAGTNKPIEGVSVIHKFDHDIVRKATTSKDGSFNIERLSQRHWGSVIGPLCYPLPYWKVMPGQPTKTNIQVSHPMYRTLNRSELWSIGRVPAHKKVHTFKLNNSPTNDKFTRPLRK